LLHMLYTKKGEEGKEKEFTGEDAKKFCKYTKWNIKSVYNALKKLESKGFVRNDGGGRIAYKLTKMGEIQADIYSTWGVS